MPNRQDNEAHSQRKKQSKKNKPNRQNKTGKQHSKRRKTTEAKTGNKKKTPSTFDRDNGKYTDSPQADKADRKQTSTDWKQIRKTGNKQDKIKTGQKTLTDTKTDKRSENKTDFKDTRLVQSRPDQENEQSGFRQRTPKNPHHFIFIFIFSRWG